MPQSITIGSQAHKELMCRFFIDSHLAFDAAAVRWPALWVEDWSGCVACRFGGKLLPQNV